MQLQSLKSISYGDIQSLQNTRIFVAGDVILDSYIEGKVSRISPEAPVPILLETGKKYAPGGAGNVSANIASMGAHVKICGRVGHDAEAAILKQCLDSYGVDPNYLIFEKNTLTTTKTRIVSYHEFTSNTHQLVRMDRELTSPLNLSSMEFCQKSYQDFIAEGGQCALVLSDYGKGFLTIELIQSLIQISMKYNIPVIVDPKSMDVKRYQNATVIKPNLSEGRALFKSTNNVSCFSSFQEEISTIAKYYLEASGCHNIVMSLSQYGVLVMSQNTEHNGIENIARFNTNALQVSDVSGAGDTLIAFLAMGLAAKMSLYRATEIGNLAAGIVCGKAGTAVISNEELFDRIHTQCHTSPLEKIMNLQNLIPMTRSFQRKNKKIVFTNGCFDILHAGHVDYLQKAKSLGDLLIIGLNADESIKRLKGPMRPVQTASDRARILAALSCVDFIVEFVEDTPLKLILALKPDLLIKGADYNISNTIGAQEVFSWGGQVQHIELLAGRSTTEILNRI